MSFVGNALRVQLGVVVRETRVAIGWSQKELGRRAGISQPEISKVERARVPELSFETAGRLLESLGVRASLDLRTPFLADRQRQRDAAHARCVAYVARRLQRLGWLTRTEVEIVSGTARGWIDVLAFRAADGLLLVIEVKTELEDIGLVQRQLAWYERGASQVARIGGWHARDVIAVLVVLASERNVERITFNRDLLAQTFGLRVAPLVGLLKAPAIAVPRLTGPTYARAIALIDPYERSGSWLMRTSLERRPAPPRYVNYADFMARMRAA